MLKKLILLLVIMTTALTGCGSDKNSANETRISISGAFALYPMVVRWSDEYPNKNVKFDISAGGAGKGLTDVLAGAVDIAMVSREVREEETNQGAYPIAVTKDAVVPVINVDNPVLELLLQRGLTPADVNRLWLQGNAMTWGELVGSDNGDTIHIYTRSDSSGAAEMWAKYAGGEAQEELQGIAVQGDPGLAEAVRQDRLAIGYNNIGFAYNIQTGEPIDGLRVVPLDLNNDGEITPDEDFYASQVEIATAIAEGRYPSPPARALYLVTNGTPSEAEAEFIRWILTDGQQYVTEAGYVLLTESQIQASLAHVE